MIAVGVDTHKHEHVAVALNELGELLGEIVVAASPAGYRELMKWLKGLGGGVLVGIEGAGSYGTGLCKHLQDVGMQVMEVERPRRRDRRTGKSDRIDALLAAKKILAREGLSTPRTSGTRAGLAGPKSGGRPARCREADVPPSQCSGRRRSALCKVMTTTLQAKRSISRGLDGVAVLADTVGGYGSGGPGLP